MTREMGSLCKDVAARVADALSSPVLHHEIIEPLADNMRVRKSHVIKLLEGRPNFFERLTADQTSLSIYTAEETFRLAAAGAGAVIRSWSAANLLRQVPHVVCARVCAPKALRVRRMKERMQSSHDALVARKLNANVSLKLTHMGLDLDEKLAREIVGGVVAHAAKLDNFVRIDMEGSPYTQKTLDIVYELHRGPGNAGQVGAVIQAYLRRSEADCR
jgi:hypothetical protein